MGEEKEKKKPKFRVAQTTAAGDFSSNMMRLSTWEWLVAIAVVIAAAIVMPRAAGVWETLQPGPDYRIPFSLGNDYWTYHRYSKQVARRFPAVVIGDSVVWGHYVKPDGTLSHHLNMEAGKDVFANLAVDGIHPAAMTGLLKHYGKGISKLGVILHLNPLWLTSPKADLSAEDVSRINHPRLLPQVFGRPRCYTPKFPEACGILLERNVGYFAWIGHVRMVYFENLGLSSWNLDHPYENPLTAVSWELPQPKPQAYGGPLSWKQRGVSVQDFPWVPTSESYQWKSFQETVRLLKRRKNRLLVFVGPLNPYIMTEQARKRCEELKSEMISWLRQQDVAVFQPTPLPTELYADTSHPILDGYERIAKQVWASETFKQWAEGVIPE